MVKETKKNKPKVAVKEPEQAQKAKSVEKVKTKEKKQKEVKETKEVKPREEKLEKAKAKDPESVVIKKHKKPVKASSKSKRFRKIEKITSEHRMNRGVIYLGHIPYGFFEDEMKEFFSQFGKVTRLKLARSKKTARSKGYAFIEFENLETASIAADTMNNRFMFDRQLVCHLVEDENIHKNMFKYCDKKWKFIPYQKINSKNLNAKRTDECKCRKVIRLLEQEKMKKERIKELGIKYDYPGYAAIIKTAQQEVKNA